MLVARFGEAMAQVLSGEAFIVVLNCNGEGGGFKEHIKNLKRQRTTL